MAAVALGNEELFQSYVVCSEYDSRKYDTKDTLVTQLTYGKIHAGSLQNSKTESNWYLLQMIIWIKKLFYNPISFMRILKMTRRETFQSNLPCRITFHNKHSRKHATTSSVGIMLGVRLASINN